MPRSSSAIRRLIALLAFLLATMSHLAPAESQQRLPLASSSILYRAPGPSALEIAPGLPRDLVQLPDNPARSPGTYRWTGAIIGAVLAGTATLVWTSAFNEADSGDAPNVAASTAIAVFAGGLTGALIGGLFKKHPPDPAQTAP
jgi:hypothetical protein